MVRRQRFPNQWDSPLNGAVNSSQTTWTVDDASALPTEGDFHIACDSEIALCTSRSGNILTVVRGVSPSTHSDNRDVYTILTKEGMLAGNQQAGYDFSLPEPLAPHILQDRDGTEFETTDFTLRNGSGDSLSKTNGLFVFRCHTHTDVNHFTGYTITTPTAPWTATAHLAVPIMTGGASANKFGIGMRGTSGGRMTLMAFSPDYRVLVRRQNTFLSWDSTPAFVEYYNRQDCWMRISSSSAASNPVWRFQTSFDGYTWTEIYTENENDFVNSSYQFGFWANNATGSPTNNQYHLKSLILEPSEILSDFTV